MIIKYLYLPLVKPYNYGIIESISFKPELYFLLSTTSYFMIFLYSYINTRQHSIYTYLYLYILGNTYVY